MKVVRAVTVLTVSAAILLAAGAARPAAHDTKADPPEKTATTPQAITVVNEYKLPLPKGIMLHPPSISGDWVVVSHNTDKGNAQATGRVLAYNLSTKKLQTIWPSESPALRVDDNLATWVDSWFSTRTGQPDIVDTYTFGGQVNQKQPGNILVYDLSTGRYYCPAFPTPTPWCTANFPVISGKYLALQTGAGIRLVDMAADAQWLISEASSSNLYLEIGGDFVVWLDKSEKDHDRIRVYKISTKETLTIEPEPAGSYSGLVTDGKTIVWYSIAGNAPIYAYDIKTGKQTKVAEGHYPAIDNGLVVYNGRAKGGLAVYGKYLPTGEEFRISKDLSDRWVAVSGNHVIWLKNDEMYCAELDLGDKKGPIAKPLSSP